MSDLEHEPIDFGKSQIPEEKQSTLYKAAEASMQDIAREVDKRLPPGFGFAVIAFNFHENRHGIKETLYVANCDRASMIEALEEMAKRLRKGS